MDQNSHHSVRFTHTHTRKLILGRWYTIQHATFSTTSCIALTHAQHNEQSYSYSCIATVCGAMTDHAPGCIIIVWSHYTHTFEVAYNCASRNKMHHCTYIMALVLTSVLYSYRPVVPPPGAGSSKVMSTSLPSSTHLATSTASASPGIYTNLWCCSLAIELCQICAFLQFSLHLGKVSFIMQYI